MPRKLQFKLNRKNSLRLLAVFVVIVGIGGVVWGIQAKQAQEQANRQGLVSGPLLPEDRLAIENQQKEKVNNGSTPGTSNDQTSSNATGSNQSSNTSTPTTSAPAAPTQTTGGTSSAPTTGGTTSPAPAASTITRPTAQFCSQKNGASFTNAWVTDNRSHTYQIYDNGWVSKTETGTAALSYNTMQVVGVLPYLTQPSWSICSDKAGYIMVYYQPPSSVYTYNWLVPFEHISITKP